MTAYQLKLGLEGWMFEMTDADWAAFPDDVAEAIREGREKPWFGRFSSGVVDSIRAHPEHTWTPAQRLAVLRVLHRRSTSDPEPIPGFTSQLCFDLPFWASGATPDFEIYSVAVAVTAVVGTSAHAFLTAYFQKLGEAAGEQTMELIRRSRVRRTRDKPMLRVPQTLQPQWLPADGHVYIELDGAWRIPDEAWLALLSLDLADPELRDAVISWDIETQKWQPNEERTTD